MRSPHEAKRNAGQAVDFAATCISIARTDAMKDEYDFSKGERGKFYRPGAALVPPVHLDPDVLAFLTARAAARGVSLSELINALLKKSIELIEASE
jgi:hypothetical protein